jgi:glutamate dehydrogenase/leucine dehydrogenase
LFVTRETLKRVGRELAGSTVAIQGFGNVGSNTARLLHAAGATVVAVSDVSGAIYDPRGLDMPRVLAYYRETGQLRGFPGTQQLDNQELLRLPVDVLLPAAMESQINADNAGEIQARIIVEGANGPTTPEADMILTRRGILVVPDILANAGGVVVSYFEWVQDRYGYFWKEPEVNERLEEKMVSAFDAVWNTKEKFEVNARTAAYILAVDRIIEARTLRGLYA